MTHTFLAFVWFDRPPFPPVGSTMTYIDATQLFTSPAAPLLRRDRRFPLYVFTMSLSMFVTVHFDDRLRGPPPCGVPPHRLKLIFLYCFAHGTQYFPRFVTAGLLCWRQADLFVNLFVLLSPPRPRSPSFGAVLRCYCRWTMKPGSREPLHLEKGSTGVTTAAAAWRPTRAPVPMGGTATTATRLCAGTNNSFRRMKTVQVWR